MKKIWQIAFLLFLIVGTILIVRNQRSMPYQHNSGMVFGTFYNVTYQCDQDLKAEIEAELKKVDFALSIFNDSSVISHINKGETTIPDDTQGDMFCNIVKLALDISKETNGAFDITVAPLVNLWGFGFKAGTTPTQHAIDSIRQMVGYEKISLDSQRRILNKKNPQTMLDCSAIAKGYGSDVVASLLLRHDVTNFMVEIGGEIVTRGVNPKRVPWHIGITKPTEDSLSTGEIEAIINVTDKAMATSGNYRNFYYKDGKKYAHTIDPKTGKPVQHNILSATVLAKNCATADAYATSFMVMGLEGAQEVLKRHHELMAYLIYTDAKGDYAVWFSPTLKEKIVDN